jgi:hypothetical protein
MHLVLYIYVYLGYNGVLESGLKKVLGSRILQVVFRVVLVQGFLLHRDRFGIDVSYLHMYWIQ